MDMPTGDKGGGERGEERGRGEEMEKMTCTFLHTCK